MNNIYNFLKTVTLKPNYTDKVSNVLIIALSIVLVCIPLPFIYGSLSCILLILLFLIVEKNKKFSFNFALFIPILYFILICFSLIWTIDIKESVGGLQKEIILVLLPIVFLFFKKVDKQCLHKIFEIYSIFMVLFALIKISAAAILYFQTENIDVFFYHELVSLDLNAIYVSAFSSFALFYFLQIEHKIISTQISIAILAVFIFLLSSKSIIFIDFILVIYFYINHAKVTSSVKLLTISCVSLFIVFSLIYVKQIRERFLIEYETAFTDNTVNKKITDDKGKVYNISLRQAWNNKTFKEDQFFPGTALRVYQLRIFMEIIQENNAFIFGFGHNAAQSKIKEKEIHYHLYSGYGDFNFHNQYTQTFAEIGVFGFIILLLMVLLNLKNAIHNKDFLHIVFAVTMIILFLTESLLCRQRGIVFFITLYCLFNSVSNHSLLKKEI